MKNILVVCSAGMSTSLLVNKMKEAAEKKHVEVKIWAISEAEIKNHIDEAHVVLLGPQIRFMVDKIRAAAGNKPVEVINMADYGMMNGEKVLETALEKIGDGE